jgi:pyruvyl transferase EpsO
LLIQDLPKTIEIKGLLPNLEPPINSRFEKATLIFPGGGSLGNRYESSKRRVNLIEKTKPDSILQMPISTTFANNSAPFSKERVGCAYNSTKASKVFARDSKSVEEANAELNISAQLARDLSSFLPPMADLRIGGQGPLLMLRTDQEGVLQRTIGEKIGVVADWQHIYKGYAYPLRFASLIYKVINSSKPPYNLKWTDAAAKIRMHAARTISEIHTARALAFLSTFDSVITDRLHGVLLAQKLELPICVVDNDHGKLSRYLHTWEIDALETKKILLCENLEEAVQQSAMRDKKKVC